VTSTATIQQLLFAVYPFQERVPIACNVSRGRGGVGEFSEESVKSTFEALGVLPVDLYIVRNDVEESRSPGAECIELERIQRGSSRDIGAYALGSKSGIVFED